MINKDLLKKPVRMSCLKGCGIVLILLLALAKPAISQSDRPINLSNHLSGKPADTVALIDMISLSHCVHPTDPDLATRLLKTALQRSKALKFNDGIFHAYNGLCYGAQFRGDQKAALSYLFQAAPYATSPGNSNKLYINVGMCYSNMGKYELALDYLLQGLAKNKEHNTYKDSVYTFINSGVLWSRMDEEEEALKHLNLAVTIANRVKDSFLMASAYVNAADVYYKTKQLKQADIYYQRVLAIASKKANTSKEQDALNSLAMLAQDRNEYALALGYLNRSMAIASAQHMSANNMLNTRAALGSVYLAMKDYTKAKPLLIATLAEARASGSKELLKFLEPKVAEVFAATGQYQQAYEHIQLSVGINDSLFAQEKKRSLDVWMNSRMAEKDKAMLAQQLYITRQKNQLREKNFWIGGTVLGALLLLSLIVALVRSSRHRQASQQSVIYQLQQKQEINQLKAQVQGEEQERQRIAHELHDSIAGQLWAIKLNVDNLRQQEYNPEIQGRNLSTIFQQLTDATQDVRKTAHNLMPDLLLEEGLATALASVCEKTDNNTKLEVDFQEYGIIPRLDQAIELSIYRMVQELIQNVLKHAVNATHLLVQLSCVDTMLSITVEDNGVAFRERDEEEGIGLQQIRKRTTSLKGHFDLQSLSGKGTTAYLEFDLQHLL